MYKNILSLDTVKAFTKVHLNTYDLVNKKKWKVWKNNKGEIVEFNKTEFNIYFRYLPQYYHLEVKFSASKVMNTTNAIPFDFNDRNLLIQCLNVFINIVLHEEVIIPNFEEWTVSELHPYIDYKCRDELTAITYQKCISKLKFSRCKNTVYKTGNQAKTKSYSNNIYIKENEIEYRLNKKPESVSDKEKELLSHKTRTLRYEVQAKKGLLQYMFGKNRKVKDILNYESCKKIIDTFIEKNNFNNPFLYKDQLFAKIDATFSKIKSRNIKKFIELYNKKNLEEVEKYFKKSTINSYLRELKSKNINQVYLPNNVAHKINLTFYASIGIYDFIEKVIEIIIKELAFDINSSFGNICHLFGFKITYNHIPAPFYYEEGG